jgi:hypothetical protein
MILQKDTSNRVEKNNSSIELFEIVQYFNDSSRGHFEVSIDVSCFSLRTCEILQ